MRQSYIFVVVSAAFLAFGCAAIDDPESSAMAEGRECFRAASVNSFTPVGRDAVNVRVGVNDFYRLELIGTCPDIDWAWQIALRTRGSSWVCRGYDAELVVPHPSGTQYCPVRAVRKLSDAEVEAFRNR